MKLGCGAMGNPNWSSPVAVNCCTPPGRTSIDAGETAIDVSVWLTVTLTLLVAVNPPASAIVTWKAIVARLSERGRGVLGCVAAIGAETDRRRRRARGGPGVAQVRLAGIVRTQHREIASVPVTGFGEAAAATATVGA